MSNNKKRSICFFTVSHPMYGLGGAELQSYYLAKEFVRNGWEVYFLTKRKNKRTNFKLLNDGIKIVLYGKGRTFIATGINILSMLMTIKPQYVYYRYHKFHIGFIWLFAVLTGCKYFWVTMHNDYCDKNAAIRVSFSSATHIKNIIKKSFVFMKLQMEKFLFVEGVKHCNGIIVQNELQLRTVIKEFNPKRIRKIYNGHTLPEKIEQKKYDIIFVATLKNFKRPFLFFEILKKLDQPYKVVMVGRNFSNKKDAGKILSLVIKFNVEYLGELTPAEVNEVIAQSRILVNTSSEEGFPNTFIQAWLRGVPVVSLIVDPDSLITQNNLGYVCNNDTEQAAKKIKKLLNNNELLNEMSKKCQIFAEENFSLQKKGQELEKFILERIN